MPLNLASPGIIVREVDITTGRVDPTSNSVAAIVAPFEKGPVESAVTVSNEQELLVNFGQPSQVTSHYENWFVASSYLAYGGNLQVLRSDGVNLTNAKVGTASSVKIKSYEDYVNKGYDETPVTGITFAAKNPGSWGNSLRVAVIDARADQVLSGISTSAVTNTTFIGITTASNGDLGITTSFIIGITTSGIGIGNTLKEISSIIGAGTTVIGITTNATYSGGGAGGLVQLSQPTLNAIALDNVEISFGYNTTTTTSAALAIGYGVTQAVTGRINPGAGTTSTLTGYLRGIITGVGTGTVDVKIISHVSAGGTETNVDYQPEGVWKLIPSGSVAIHTNGQSSSYGNVAYTASPDWYDLQTIPLLSSSLSWNAVANRPSTSNFAASRGSRFDELHVVILDADGKITGNEGTILEKHLSLSKAKNAIFSAGSPSYWNKYISEGSSYIFAGSEPTGVVTTGFSASSSFTLSSTGNWNTITTDNLNYKCIGSYNNILTGGKNYDGNSDLTLTTSLASSLTDLSSGYDLLTNTEEYDVDFILMGSSSYGKEISQALASKIIAVAEERKDAIAFISPHKEGLLQQSGTSSFVPIGSSSITDNIIGFFSPIPSSSYAVFDSGYKYMYDRFSGTFRYIPLNGDIAGMCARTDASGTPWVSPAGTSRGSVLNAVKLAYNPSKIQRDRLYSNRINPVIMSPGSGIILFGDKTGLAKASAFDRINVRRLFVYIENAVSVAARNQLFEFNDSITRSSFVNTVEPFLRDLQSKRAISDFRVLCDESNNTASIIDSNELIADIYIKPSRSINFIGLTFVATRSGVSFDEIVGTV